MSNKVKYDCYVDDEFVVNGTVDEIAEYLGLSRSTVAYYRYRPPKSKNIKLYRSTKSNIGTELEAYNKLKKLASENTRLKKKPYRQQSRERYPTVTGTA